MCDVLFLDFQESIHPSPQPEVVGGSSGMSDFRVDISAEDFIKYKIEIFHLIKYCV